MAGSGAGSMGWWEPDPFPHLVVDDYFHAGDVAAARASWPADDWAGWVRYDPRIEGKRASDLHTPLPPACAQLLYLMSLAPVSHWFGDRMVPDLGLCGAGLHEMGPGDHLGLHLDADRHRRLGLERRLSMVLAAHDRWDGGWGGELELWQGEAGRLAVERVGSFAPIRSILPRPGRLVVFDSRDAFHSVAPLKCPDGLRRMTLALFWYRGVVRTPGLRPRALFVPRPGGDEGDDLNRVRRERSK